MEWAKVCAVMGVAGESELTALTQFAREGWNIAFMDSDEKAGPKFMDKLQKKYGIIVYMVNAGRQGEGTAFEGDYDIEGFFYHGSWEDEEDIDIYRGFLEGRYGGINYVIESAG